MRSALRDAEVTPPADGWARLERELGPAPRVSVLRSYWPRIAAAAAAVLIFLGGGGYLLHENRDLGDKGFVIATATDSGSFAADMADSDKTQAGDGAGTLAGAVRSAVPSEEEVRAASLPGAESRGSVAPVTGRQPQLVAAAGTGGVEAGHAAVPDFGGTAGRSAVAGDVPAENVSGDAPDHIVAENAAAEKRPVSRAAVPEQPAAGGGRGKEPSGQAVQARKYPGTYDYLAEDLPDRKRPGRKTSVSLFAAGGVAGASGATGTMGPNLMMSDVLISGTNGTMAQLKYNYEDYSFRHHQPLSFGFSVRKEFAHGLSLESGVNYTLLWSDVRMQSSREDISQKLHFIGVPLRMNWQFLETGRFSMYIGAGGMVEKCVAAKFGSKSVDESKVQWSVTGAAGAQYRLGNLVGLYFEPEISHYFTETTLRTSRTDSSVSLTLRLGVRLSF